MHLQKQKTPLPESNDGFVDTFRVEKADFSSTGGNRYFSLKPGFQMVYEGKEDGKPTVLTITVLDKTRTVDGVETRIVEEHETSGGKLVEVSRNYFAISKKTGDVFYFGEDVDIYKGGKVSSHDGSWLAGRGGARFGLQMPAKPAVGGRYYQEVAPGLAMDRAETISLGEAVETPSGKFSNCVKTAETSTMEKGTEYKLYAPGIGLVQDDGLKLVKYGGRVFPEAVRAMITELSSQAPGWVHFSMADSLRAVQQTAKKQNNKKLGKTKYHMKSHTIIKSLLAIAIAATLGLGGTASAKDHEKDDAALEAQAKVSKADAQATALAKVPGGTVKEAEIEKEKGVLIWSFDITTAGTKDITEVNVDATTGKIVNVEVESANKKDEDDKD